MNRETKEYKAFTDQIAANPNDLNNRRIFADWLDEHDEPELANEQRKMVAEAESGVTGAKARMMEAAMEYNTYCKTPEESYQKLLSDAQDGDIVFYGKDGYEAEFLSEYPEFWNDVELLTSKKIDDNHRENASFHCAC